MRLVERLQRMRGRLVVVAGIAFPLASAVAWGLAGRTVLCLMGVAAAAIGAWLYRRRLGHPLFLLPIWLVGDPNKRKPIIIERERWPRGQG